MMCILKMDFTEIFRALKKLEYSLAIKTFSEENRTVLAAGLTPDRVDLSIVGDEITGRVTGYHGEQTFKDITPAECAQLLLESLTDNNSSDECPHSSDKHHF